MPQLRAPDGSIVDVPDEQAGQLVAGGYEPVGLGQAGAVTGAKERPTSGAVLGPLGATASSFLSGATLGLSDVALKGLLNREGYERLAADREDNPTLSGVGQFLGAFAGGPTPAGYLSKATGAIVEGGGLAAKLAGAAGEGAVWNAGAYLADTALGDRDLSAEGLVGALGSGMEFGAVGGAAFLGLEQGTIAARRMFSRLTDGTSKAAEAAEQAWAAKYQATLEAHDAAADIARAKLAEAQLARQQAQAAQQRAVAELADARAAAMAPGGAPEVVAGEPAPSAPAAAPAAPAGAPPPTPSAPPPSPDVEIAGLLRDRAVAAMSPEKLAAWDAANGPRLQAAMEARGARSFASGPAPAVEPSAEAALQGFARGPETPAARYAALSKAAEDELSAALAAHDAARADLEDVLARIEAPGVQAPAEVRQPVPVGEFGEPGRGGFKSQDELAQIAAGSEGHGVAPALEPAPAESTRVLRGGAKGTPVGPAEVPSIGEAAGEGTAVGKRSAAPAAETPPSALGSRPLEVRAIREGRKTTFEATLPDGSTRTLADRGEVAGLVDSQLPSGFQHGRFLETHRNLAVEQGLPKDAASIRDNALYVARPSDLADHGIAGGALTPEREVSLAEARQQGKALDPIEIKVDAEGRYWLDDGNHRLQEAAKTNAPVAIKFTPVQKFEWTGGSFDITDRLRSALPREGTEGASLASSHANGGEVPVEDLQRRRDELSRFMDANPDHPGTEAMLDEHDALNREINNRYSRPPAGVGLPESAVRNSDGTGVIKRPVQIAPEAPQQTGAAREIGNEDEFRAMQRKLQGELTPEELKQAKLYTRELYIPVNRHLRGIATGDIAGDKEAIESIIPSLDKVLDKSVTTEPIITHRTVTWDKGEAGYNLRPGDTFVDPGYMSTSWRPDVHQKYGNVNFIITSPAGTHLAALPSMYSEGELLLPRGTRLRITGRSEEPGGGLFGRDRITLHATVEPAAGAHAGSTIAATDTLTGQLQGTAAKLGAGDDLAAMGAPARASYLAAKEARTAEAAEHFRGRALAKRAGLGDPNAPWNEGFGPGAGGPENSRMAAEERAAQAEHQAGVVGRRAGVGDARRGYQVAKAGHPMAAQELEQAHAAAAERAETAATPAERAAAGQEAQAIERQMTAVGARPGAVEDVAAVADTVTKYEKASARLTEALGADAPPEAQAAAKALRAAEDEVDRKTIARTTRAVEDHVASGAPAPTSAAEYNEQRAKAGLPDALAKPPKPGTSPKVAGAKAAKLRADAELARARAGEVEAKAGADTAKRQASEARAAAEEAHPAPPEPAPPSKLGSVLTAVGVAGELGIPGIPHPKDIPLIGPLLSTYLKYRAVKAAAGRFVGRIPATGDARAAALVAKTKDRIATAVDRTLGLAAELVPKARTPLVVATTMLGHRVFDDGQPDAPKDASAQEMAAVRIREISAAATRPDLVATMVRQRLGGVTDPDLIDAATQTLQAQFKYLAGTMPKAPPPNPYAKTQWVPSAGDTANLARRIAVMQDPQAAIDNPTPAGADALANFYPKLAAFAQQRLADRAADLKNPVAYPQLVRASLVFNVPLHASLQPENAAVLRGAFAAIAGSMGGPGPAGGAPAPSISAPTNLDRLYQPDADRRAQR